MATLRNWSACLIVAVSSCAYARGSRPPRDIKVYSIQPDDSFCNPMDSWCMGKSGLVRKQAKEVKPFEESEGYLALSPEDFQRIISTCPTPN